MIRATTLLLTLAALTPLSPFGCPPADSPDGGTDPPRGKLTVNALAPQAATVGQVVELEAEADAQDVFYSWLQTAGTGVAIENAYRARARFTAPSLATAQQLKFMVTARNNNGDVGQAEVGVGVTADPNYGQGGGPVGRPVADAGVDQTVKQGTDVTLDASGSSGRNLTFRWRQVSGSAVTLSATDAVRPRFTCPNYDLEGTNVMLFELTVTDDEDRAATDRTQVSIKDPYVSDTEVDVETTLGTFRIELDPEKAPITVANFLQYVDDEFYDNTLFHRVIPDFVIQGGGYDADTDEEKETRDPIENEADNGLSNVRGTIAMARLSAPDTATSQFFVNLVDNTEDGEGSNLDPGGVSPDGYAVFGKVISGMDIVDKIAEVETDSSDKPVEDVVINSIRRVRTTPPASGGSTTTDPTGGTTTRDELGG